jgi:Protein of unknown function (DUF4238)
LQNAEIRVKLAKRNHYNPCFWTALWNPDYYRAMISGASQVGSARTQKVYVLSVKSAKIFQSTVENVHYDKNLGVAEISREAVEEFARRYHPDRYEQFVRDNADATYPVFIDLEQLLSRLETLPPYQVLLDVVRRVRIETPEEKVYLGCFVLLQFFRSHAIMNSMIEWHEELQRHKFEHFVTLKWLLSDPELLFAYVQPIVACSWTLFATDEDVFPLCDSPILVKPNSVMVALSPRLMLEAQRLIPARENEWRIRRSVSRRKVEEFRRRTIGNTFREIIGDRQILERWRSTPEFCHRVAAMKDAKHYNRLIWAKGTRELWQLNAYGNKG